MDSDKMQPETDVVLAKIAIMKKCVATVELVRDSADIPEWMREDLSVLNLQRAIQAAIDLAHVVIARYGLGLPSGYAQAFELLRGAGVIDRETAADLKKMVGFRNVAVHEYQQIDGDIVVSIVKHHLDDFERYYTQVHRFVFGVKGERDAFTGIKDA